MNKKFQDFVNWIKVNSAACSAMGLNKRKYSEISD